MGSLLKSKYARARAARSVKSVHMSQPRSAATPGSSGQGGRS